MGLSDQNDCFSFMDLLWKMVIIDRVEEEMVAGWSPLLGLCGLIEMRSESGV